MDEQADQQLGIQAKQEENGKTYADGEGRREMTGQGGRQSLLLTPGGER